MNLRVGLTIGLKPGATTPGNFTGTRQINEAHQGEIAGSWELQLIKKVARTFRTTEKDDLEGELSKKLLELKSQRRPDIRNWKAYVAKFLFNKAANLVRNSRARHRNNERRQSRLVLALEKQYRSE